MCKHGENIHSAMEAAARAGVQEHNMREFDHILRHLCDAVAMLFSLIEHESRIKAILYIVGRTDEIDQMIEAKKKELTDNLPPSDDQITLDIVEKAQEALKNMREQPKH